MTANASHSRYSANSLMSKHTSSAGSKRAIWRHSSEADRPAGAGHHHHLATQVRAPGGVDAHRIAAEEIFHVHVRAPGSH